MPRTSRTVFIGLAFCKACSHADKLLECKGFIQTMIVFNILMLRKSIKVWLNSPIHISEIVDDYNLTEFPQFKIIKGLDKKVQRRIYVIWPQIQSKITN